MIHYGTIRYDTIRYDTIRYDTVQGEAKLLASIVTSFWFSILLVREVQREQKSLKIRYFLRKVMHIFLTTVPVHLSLRTDNLGG